VRGKRLCAPLALGLGLVLILVTAARWQSGTTSPVYASGPAGSPATGPITPSVPAALVVPDAVGGAADPALAGISASSVLTPRVYLPLIRTPVPPIYLPLILKPLSLLPGVLPPPIPMSGIPPIDFDAIRTGLLANGQDLAFVKIGFHVGPGGDVSGLCDAYGNNALAALDAAGVPFFIKSVDTAGQCFYDAHQIAQSSSVPHTLVYRRAGEPSEGWDVPDYAASPQDAASAHWIKHRNAFPTELEPSLVWIETVNEIAKEFVFPTESELEASGLVSPYREKFQRFEDESQTWVWVLTNAEWLGAFAYETAQLVLAEDEPYRWAAFAWSSGEPEPDHWEGPQMLEFLRLAGEHPDRLAIALHEYSYTVDDIANLYHYLVGRFQLLFQVCDAYNIPRPTVLITEWGWEYQDVPDPATAMEHIAWASWLYAAYPQVQGAAIWYLGGGFGDIALQARDLIVPWQAYALSHYFIIQQGQGTIDPAIFRP
jgi:hypothetical protein